MFDRDPAMSEPDSYDAIVIGAGPAGLTAALYLARFRRAVLVVHDGTSRALRIPKTHNVPGFPDGVAGPELIERMTGHATEYGAQIREATIVEVAREGERFSVRTAQDHLWSARAVILATGVHLNEVDLPAGIHERAIEAGVLRYCPICDGYEHRDQRIGVLGCDTNGAAEALFIRGYSDDVTLMPLTHPELSAAQSAELAHAGIKVETGAMEELILRHQGIEVKLEGREAPLAFDVLYPALGCLPRAELAEQLGIELDPEGCLAAGAVRDSGIPGLLAAGDVIAGLDQISVAMGHGAIAATCIHNWLRARDHQTLVHR
jgi:thioredoxin reductase (NADPH)